MKSRLCLSMTALILMLALSTRADEPKPTAAALFDPSTVRTLHLKFSGGDWEAIEPTKQRQSNAGAAGGPMRRMEYPVVHATVEFEGKIYPDVATRYKGNSSFMMARNSLKKSFKLDFNQFVEKQSFFGLTSVNLNNNAGDPTASRETLAYELFAAAKVPAPRTTLLRVELTVPGKYDHQFLGLYTLVEDVGKRFLKNRFGDSKGLLVKPERARDLPYLGERWDDYTKVYAPKTDGNDAAKKRLIEFLKLVHQADDAMFDKQIESLLDVDEFLRFLAVNAITSTLDSLLSSGHNFYIHVPAKSGLIQFIPWDLNEAFGGFGMSNSTQLPLQLSLTHPHAGENKLIQRLLATPRFAERYKKIVSDLAAGPFSVATMNDRIDAIAKRTADARTEEKKSGIAVGFPGPGGPGGPGMRPNNPPPPLPGL